MATSPTTRIKPAWLQILLALVDGNRHGLEIMRQVEATTEGQTKLWPAALYGALDALTEHGWILETEPPAQASRSGAPRYFALTGSGRSVLEEELARLDRFLARARARTAGGTRR